MRQVREVLRLKHIAGHSERRIAGAIGISRYTVAEYLRRATVVGITWPVPAELDDSALEARLFSPPFAAHENPRPQPDLPRLHAELRRPGVTLLLLWEEYRAGQPDGYGYSRFCDLYRDWRAGISPTMRQTHVTGERLFVDFAGQTVRSPIRSPAPRGKRRSSSPLWAPRTTPTPKPDGRRGWQTALAATSTP
jgi:transposase